MLNSVPPHSINAENAVNGSVFVAPIALDEISWLKPEDFYHFGNGQIFSAFLALRRNGTPIDVVTVRDKLGDQLQECGGDAQLIQCLEAVPHAAHVQYYAQIVSDHSRRRQLIGVGRDLILEAQDQTCDITEQCAKVTSKVGAVADGRDPAAGPISAADGVRTVFEALAPDAQKLVIETGFPEVDRMLGGGVRQGQQIVLGAQTGVGKSTVASNIAVHAAKSGHPCLIVSLEMRTEEWFQRILASESGVDHEVIRRGQPDEQTYEALCVAGERIMGLPLHVDDKPRKKVADILAIARKLKLKFGCVLLIVDYLQLLTPDDPKAIREQQVAAMSRQLKLLAKELDMAVITLAQLNRGLENREDKTPKLSDLRESGAIEQDADIVLFLTRSEKNEGDATLTVAKNRSGPRGKCPLYFRSHTLTFLPGTGHVGGDF